MGPATFEEIAAAERPRLLAIAYRMVGSRTEAEDLVQEAILRAHRSMPADVESPAAYLTTIVTRLAVDHLRSARVRREAYVGPWLPEPIAVDPAPEAAASAELADHLSMAFLVVLESLTPDERAALLLHDVFAYRHAEIGAMLDRSEVASRQLLRRARARVEERRPRLEVDPAGQQEVVRRFVDACRGGDLDAFLALLTDDAVLTFDGGPDVRTAARRPIRGADRVARFLAHVMDRLDGAGHIEATTLNGGPAATIRTAGGEPVGAVFLESDHDGRAATLRWIRNPSKLAAVRTG